MKRYLPIFALVLAAGCTSVPTSSPTPRTTPPVTPPTTQQSPAVMPDVEIADNVLADLPHQRVDYWVDRFSRGDKRPEIEAAFARMPQVETMIRTKLREHGMPEDLLYLAMAESSFNPQAHSTAAALGIWQLVPGTARQYGLRVDDTVDERRDAEKSTDAAIKYLTYLHNRFGSWYLAAAAYNAGPNRVSGIMRQATGAEAGRDADYYRIWDLLPGETRDYVPATIALMRLGKDRARYGF